MKKFIYYSSIFLLLFLTICIFNFEGFDRTARTILIEEIEEINSGEYNNMLTMGLTPTNNTLIRIKDDVAYDRNKNLSYSPHSNISISKDKQSNVYLYFDNEKKIHHIIAINNENIQEINLIITNTPLINIKTVKEKRRPLKKDYDKVILTSHAPDPLKETQRYQIKMNQRGGSSIVYPKKSFTLNNLNKQEMSIFGLPMNKKYVLNSMYEDEFKIRDVLSWDIWSESSAYSNERELFNSAEMIYVEVFIDDEYNGMYGLQEHMNENKLDLVRNKGTIFKFNSWVFPRLENFDSKSNYWDSLEVHYSNLSEEKKWFGFDEYIKFFDSLPYEKNLIDKKIDMSSFKDYYIFLELVNARDNMWKNRFMSREADKDKLMISPWDLDMTFGSGWTGELPYLTESSIDRVHILYDKNTDYFISKILKYHPTFELDSAKRYFELREDEWSKENLLGKIRFYEAYLSETGIYERDSQRWPEGPKIKSGMENFISEALFRKMYLLDTKFESVIRGEES